jgi:hypothetical protein
VCVWHSIQSGLIDDEDEDEEEDEGKDIGNILITRVLSGRAESPLIASNYRAACDQTQLGTDRWAQWVKPAVALVARDCNRSSHIHSNQLYYVCSCHLVACGFTNA